MNRTRGGAVKVTFPVQDEGGTVRRDHQHRPMTMSGLDFLKR